MRKYLSLTKRNCLVFLRDRTSVFFALLSMLIVLLLQAVFLGDMNVESVLSLIEEYGGEMRDAAADELNARQLVQYWTLAGILVVNAVTVTLSVIGTMIEDASENRIADFYCAPVSKVIVALSYVTTAAIIGTLFCMLTLAAALIFICAVGGTMLSFAALGKILLFTLLNVCIFSVIMYMVALFVKSSSAWGGLGTIVGTLVGFVGAIYLPMGSLPATVAEVLKYIPILHGTSLMRKVCCEEAINMTFAGMPEEFITEYKEVMGITISMQGKDVSDGMQILFLVCCGIAALLVSVWIVRKKNLSDR